MGEQGGVQLATKGDQALAESVDHHLVVRRGHDRAFATQLLHAMSGEPQGPTIDLVALERRSHDRAFADQLLDAFAGGTDLARPRPHRAHVRPPAPPPLRNRQDQPSYRPRHHPVTTTPRPAEAAVRRTGPGRRYQLVKSFFDRLDAALLLLLTAPILLVAMVAVKLTSPGPVFFRQERLGKDGRRFTMLKLRTMVCDAEEQLRKLGLYERYVEAGYKLPPEEDCRLTPIGGFLRRMSVDELPQLINVIRGDMSLVGPRPIVPPELSCYGDRAECYLDVRPGLTGLWQVTGRSTVTFPERGDIDAEYHAKRSLWFDLVILARTPKVVLRGTGAY
jgi:lipopolysaccharide/colanic/teichoic acid biosynthesis glycosyltransferase